MRGATPERSSEGRIRPLTSAARPAPGGRMAGVLGGRRAGSTAGRAVLGGLLIAVAAVLVFSAALGRSDGGRTGYVVASRPLPAGATLTAGDLETARMSLTGAAGGFRDPGALVGRSLGVAVGAGQLISAPMLAPAGGGAASRPVSVPVDATSLSGLVTGQPVDVLSVPSGQGAQAGQAAVVVVLRNVPLLGLERGSSPGLLSGNGGGAVATVGVPSLTQAEALVGAAHDSTLVLVPGEPSDGNGP